MPRNFQRFGLPLRISKGNRCDITMLVMLGLTATLFRSWNAPAGGISEIIDTASVNGLRTETGSTNVTLSWPSDPRESFVVLWRSNTIFQTPWMVLTNQLPATQNRKQTTFHDLGGLTRVGMKAAATNLLGHYAVYLIPGFWFDMNGVVFSGGPKIPREDFFPFYYGFEGSGFPQPAVGLVVDGEEAGWGPIRNERVNFGTMDKPQWVSVAGFWVRLDLLGNGSHTLQLNSMLMLNNSIGEWTQDITLTNRPVQIRVSIDETKTNRSGWWNQRFGKTLPAGHFDTGLSQHENELLESEVPGRPLFLNKKISEGSDTAPSAKKN